MRFFLVLLTFLLSFQPISWAMVSAGQTNSMTMHEQFAGEMSDIHMPENTAHMHSKAAQPTNSITPCNSAMADMQGDCFVNCLIACSAATECTTLACHHLITKFNGVVLTTLSVLFTSYTESPEIQPPLKIRI